MASEHSTTLFSDALCVKILIYFHVGVTRQCYFFFGNDRRQSLSRKFKTCVPKTKPRALLFFARARESRRLLQVSVLPSSCLPSFRWSWTSHPLHPQRRRDSRSSIRSSMTSTRLSRIAISTRRLLVPDIRSGSSLCAIATRFMPIASKYGLGLIQTNRLSFCSGMLS